MRDKIKIYVNVRGRDGKELAVQAEKLAGQGYGAIRRMKIRDAARALPLWRSGWKRA